MTVSTRPCAKATGIKFLITAILLVGAPLAGLVASGLSPEPYLAFPPLTRRTVPAAFRWPAFLGFAVLIAAAVIPLAVTGLRAFGRYRFGPAPRGRWPWWGTAAVLAGVLGWALAWTRFDWFAAFQPHTFVPLWLAYIVTVNALTFRRTGRCMMVQRPGHLGLLFAASAVFWWFFEYLNRFVENWYYQGAAYGACTYTLLATASFSTVLPAVLGTRDWLMSFDLFRRGWEDWPALRPARPRLVAAVSLAAAAAGLAGIAVWPDQLFALVWVAPLIVVASLQTLFGGRHVLGEAARGRWAPIVSASAAALVCGFFWEMWNAGSLVGWTYSVPYVQRFAIFAMPVLGYAGYLPFGLECAVVEELIRPDRFAAGDASFLQDASGQTRDGNP